VKLIPLSSGPSKTIKFYPKDMIYGFELTTPPITNFISKGRYPLLDLQSPMDNFSKEDFEFSFQFRFP